MTFSAGIGISFGEDNLPQAFHKLKGFHSEDARLTQPKTDNNLNWETPIAISKHGMLTPRYLFFEMSGFNETFSAVDILQDLDFGLRCKSYGLSMYYAPWNTVSAPKGLGTSRTLKSGMKPQYTQHESKSVFYATWKETLESCIPPQFPLTVLWDLYCGCTGDLLLTCQY
jgi:hypothetical protein